MKRLWALGIVVVVRRLWAALHHPQLEPMRLKRSFPVADPRKAASRTSKKTLRS